MSTWEDRMNGSYLHWFIFSIVVGIGWAIGNPIGSAIVGFVKALLKK